MLKILRHELMGFIGDIGQEELRKNKPLKERIEFLKRYVANIPTATNNKHELAQGKIKPQILRMDSI
jgi:hypothetical protein